MNFDFQPYFDEYKKIADITDKTFDHVKSQYTQHVKCKDECSDCCHALFDITLIEAMYINHCFNKKFEGQDREKIIEKANKADRGVYKIKKKAYKESEEGKDNSEIIASLSLERVRCPLLNDSDMCEMYQERPITCRVYGIPVSIYDRGHTCGRSGFESGKQYPTVKLDIIQDKLYNLSEKLVKDIKSKHIKLSQLLIPLSMALLTDYNEEYLGIKEK